MGYSKKRTIAEKFSLSNRKVDLPRDAVIDQIFVRFAGVLHNTTETDWTGTYADILKNITDMRIVSDGNNVHYSVKGLDIAIMNYYDAQGVTVNPDESITATKNADTGFTFMLSFSQGDILALTKDSLEFSLEINPNVAENVTISEITGVITLEENIYTTAEFQGIYGAALEASAEPKIVALEKSFIAAEELTEFMDLPTGTLLRRAFLVTSSDAGVRGGTTPGKMGIVVTTPDRREIYTVDYPTLRELNKTSSRIQNPISGVVEIDYGTEITVDEYGIRGWKFNKGDYQLAVKSGASGKIRYISCEYVVHTKTFDAVQRAIMEGTA